MGNLRATLKFTQFFFWSALLIPPQMIIMVFSRGNAAYTLPIFWHKMICRAFKLDIEVEGQPSKEQQTIYVSNHVSYLDIPVIGSILPASFVAKEEVATWPVFGLLAKLQQCVFINRARHRIGEGQSNMQQRLNSGNSIVLFPEGTSTNGTNVLPFKSSLFSVATDPELTKKPLIQPFTIELLETNGQKIKIEKDHDLYAWYADMTLAPHFWDFAKSNGAKVKLHFHAPLRVKDDDNRKNLAKTCHDKVAGVIAA